MAIIRIDFETIRKCTVDLNRQLEEIKTFKSELNSLIAEIDDTWDGDASEAYINRLKTYYKKMDKLEDLIREYKQYLENVNDDFNLLDTLWNEIKSTAKGFFLSPILNKVVK